MKIIDLLTEAKKPEPPKTRSPAAASLADRKFQQKIIPNKKKKIDPKHKKAVGMDETLDPGEYDMEGDSVKTNLHTIVRACKQLNSALADDQNLPEWVQDKVAQAKGMMVGVTEYMLSTGEREPGMSEAANPAQQAAIAIAKKKKKGVSEARKSAWEKMSAPFKGTSKDLDKSHERSQEALKGLKKSAQDYQNIVDKDKKLKESIKQYFIVHFKDPSGNHTAMVPARDEYEARDLVYNANGANTSVTKLPIPASGKEPTDYKLVMSGGDAHSTSSGPMLVLRNQVSESNKQKGVDGKACWKGYKRMGTKKKGGKTVDNCVPTGK